MDLWYPRLKQVACKRFAEMHAHDTNIHLVTQLFTAGTHTNKMWCQLVACSDSVKLLLQMRALPQMHKDEAPSSATVASLEKLANNGAPLPPYHLTTLQPYDLITLPPYHLTTLPPYHLTTLRPYRLTTLPPHHLTTSPPYHHTNQNITDVTT